MSEACARLHELVFLLPEVRWPFDPESFPRNGIYFFHECGEHWGHGDDRPRIVRVGTHREGNFRSRIADHYVIDERKLTFSRDQPAPKDRRCGSADSVSLLNSLVSLGSTVRAYVDQQQPSP
jgi:hypothetical protein